MKIVPSSVQFGSVKVGSMMGRSSCILNLACLMLVPNILHSKSRILMYIVTCGNLEAAPVSCRLRAVAKAACACSKAP